MAQEASGGSSSGASIKGSPLSSMKKHSLVSAVSPFHHKRSSDESGGSQVGANQHRQDNSKASSSIAADTDSGKDGGEDNNKTTTQSPASRKSTMREANIMNVNQRMASVNIEPANEKEPATKGAAAKEKVAKKSKKEKKKKNAKRTNKGVEDDNDDTKTSISQSATVEDPNCQRDLGNKRPVCAAAVEPKQKSLVDELKLFQNNHLLNQQDPIHQLHIQLHQLNKDDEQSNNKQYVAPNPTARQSMLHQKHPSANNLQASSMQFQPAINAQQQAATDSVGYLYDHHQFPVQYVNEENIFTVKKGTLWQQQHYDKFHQRLFSRWKKRYFILTTDYLVCFKRSTSKVGRSEMGKFLYKTALSDVTKIERLKPKKSDKGAIILFIKGQFNLFLWSKENLDEWMFMISESIERNRIRRSCQIVTSQQNDNSNSNSQGKIVTDLETYQQKEKQQQQSTKELANSKLQDASTDDIYENTAIIGCDQQQAQPPSPHLLELKMTTNESSIQSNNSSSDRNRGDILSSSFSDRETRSQTITKHSNKNSVHPMKEQVTNRRGSQEQHKKTSAYERRPSEEDTRNVESLLDNKEETTDRASLQSVASSLASNSSNDAANNSIERKRVRRREEEIAQRAGGDENKSKVDNVQTSGRVGAVGRMVIYDPTDNDVGAHSGSGGSSSEASGTKSFANQAEQSVGSPKTSTRAKQRNNSSRCPELKNQKSKESSLSSPASTSERVVSSRRGSKHSAESSRGTAVERDSCDKAKANAREGKRSGDIQQISTTSSNNAHPSSPRTVATNEDNDITNDEGQEIKCNNRSPRDKTNQAQRVQQATAGGSSSIAANNSFQIQTTASASENLTNRPLPTPTAITTNLIRRDDSWQSLVSLTRVGKVTPVAMQAQRSLYAQHIMPESNTDLTRYKQQQQQHMSSHGNRQNVINIESTITPSRGPFLRQQSVQSSIQGNRFRPLPPIGGVNTNGHPQQHAASFDLAVSNSPIMPALNQRNNTNQTSYQQKLLQLQLLHNSNNVDYIRHNNNDSDRSNDYQLYGPAESGYGYGYGYSSMRSNLKSAASEFSFIRPSSSSQTQSTLPHPPNRHHQLPQNAPLVLDTQSTRNHQLMRSSLILSAANSPHNSGQPSISSNQTSYIQKQQLSDSNNNDINNCLSPMAKQFLAVNGGPVIGERIINQQQQQQLLLAGNGSEPQQKLLGEPMMAPMRELPLKPNKKRVLNGGGELNALSGNNLPKSSSLTSSIACFFRRAFSRRSKKSRASKGCSKLAESCSSSLGAFEDGYTSGPMVPSAFSTGSKSVDGAGRNSNNNKQQVIQSPRMIDMIEAFTNKTHANEVTDTLGSRLCDETGTGMVRQYSSGAFKPTSDFTGRDSEIGTPKMAATKHMRSGLNQFGGSPLHKSNSISATMGLSFLNDQTRGSNNASFLYDNAMMAASGGSPMLMRSNKVLSTNLTSLALHQHQPQKEFGLDHQSFLSPRNSNRRSEHLPRPSSIYGQPSMISSPIISRESDRNSGNFGVHRKSLHSHHHFNRDRSKPPGPGGFDIRRHHHQMMKVPFPLDTTREVAEELPSPNTESSKLHHHDYGSARELNPLVTSHSSHNQMIEQSPSVHGGAGRYLISASPSSGKLNHRQAIVNPIFQSPTMGTIYDNHPILNGGHHPDLSTSSSSYSHYDNHNQLLMGRQQAHSNQMPSSPSFHHQQQQQPTKISGLTSSPRVHMNNDNLEDPYRQNFNVSTINQTPSHHRLSSLSDFETSPSNALGGRGNKPSAIVAPSTPYHNNLTPGQNLNFRNDSTSINGGGLPISSEQHQSNRAGLMPQSRSPMLSRRAGQHPSHYQQSPLVSSQTRVLNKGDGVQATVSIQQLSQGGNNNGDRMIGFQPVINIAGAPGINLEPSLAASLLKGTNIDAYECSTFDRLTSGQSQQNSKTFLVSTRLSKSMAYSHGSSTNENGSNTSLIKADETSRVSNSTTCTRDELSSSGSRSMNSSIGERSGGGSSRALRSSNLGTGSSHEGDQERDESSGSETRADKNVIMANRSIQQRRASDNSDQHHKASRRKKSTVGRESSSEPSDEITSQVSSSLEKPDERKWITSKLVE